MIGNFWFLLLILILAILLRPAHNRVWRNSRTVAEGANRDSHPVAEAGVDAQLDAETNKDPRPVVEMLGDTHLEAEADKDALLRAHRDVDVNLRAKEAAKNRRKIGRVADNVEKGGSGHSDGGGGGDGGGGERLVCYHEGKQSGYHCRAGFVRV